MHTKNKLDFRLAAQRDYRCVFVLLSEWLLSTYVKQAVLVAGGTIRGACEVNLPCSHALFGKIRISLSQLPIILRKGWKLCGRKNREVEKVNK